MFSSLRKVWRGSNKSIEIENLREPNQTAARPTSEDFELLARSQYFDSFWYLSAHSHVNEAGVSPIWHYLESGAASGLNPSPLFDTKWYMARNPDVSRLGLNPLVHFLRIGHLRGSEPHPFFGLRRNLDPITVPEIDKIFAHCCDAQIAPSTTSEDNWYENRAKWGCYFALRGIAALRTGDILTSLEEFKRSVQVCSDAWDYWRLYAHAFRTPQFASAWAFSGSV